MVQWWASRHGCVAWSIFLLPLSFQLSVRVPVILAVVFWLLVWLISCPCLWHYGVRTSRASILATSSTAMSTLPLLKPLPTPWPPSLHCLHLLPLYILYTPFPSLQPCILPLSSFACTSTMMTKECCLLIRDSISRLPVRVLIILCCCLCVMIAIAIVGSHSGCSCCCCCGVPVALGGKDAMMAMILIQDVSTLLMLIKDCWRGKQTNTS